MRTARCGAPATGASIPPTSNASSRSATNAAGNRRQGRRFGPNSGGLLRRLRDLASDAEAAILDGDVHCFAVRDLAAEHLLRERVLQRALNHPLQRPGAIDRIV